jgi:hypothetical protein
MVKQLSWPGSGAGSARLMVQHNSWWEQSGSRQPMIKKV